MYLKYEKQNKTENYPLNLVTYTIINMMNRFMLVNLYVLDKNSVKYIV